MVDQKYRVLLDWARQNHAFIHPSVDFVATETRGVECVVRAEAPSIEPHEVFLRVPYRLSLSYWHAVSAGKPGSGYHPHSAASLPEAFLKRWTDHEVVNAIFLVQQYLLGEASFWYSYLQVIPQPQGLIESATPWLWTEDDLRELRGTWFETEVPKMRRDFELRWQSALTALAESDWDTSEYTLDLGLWAQHIFRTRAFATLAIEPDAASIREEYHGIFKSGASIDDSPKVLIPVIDSLNHHQRSGIDYYYGDTDLGLAKAQRLAAGDSIWMPYDKDVKLANNTLLLKEFGFILADNDAPELVLAPPFDLIQSAMHPSHFVFSSASTPDDDYAPSEDIYIDILSVRAPRRHPRGLRNPTHKARALRHFHPILVSMVAFRVATLPERAALRKHPYASPSRANQQATVQFLTDHLRDMLRNMAAGEDAAAAHHRPANARRAIASAYKQEQRAIVHDVLKDMAIPSDSFFITHSLTERTHGESKEHIVVTVA